MQHDAPSPRKASAKTRIVRAAMLLFARQSFSETSLREIAAEAQVDVAYVHRAFGSKTEIFQQALHGLHVVDQQGDQGAPMDADHLIERICELALLRNPRKVEEVEPLHLIIRSCACSEARGILADFIETHFARPLAAGFGQKDIGRATFAVSLMSGFVTMRVALGHPALLAMPDAELKAMLAKVLRGVMASS
ncbi:MAG TPA: TetR/AcrR family transcriptional regulator [Roseovarius sp.]